MCQEEKMDLNLLFYEFKHTKVRILIIFFSFNSIYQVCTTHQALFQVLSM